MFRFLIQFVALLIFFAVARTVLTWLLRYIAYGFRAATQTAAPPREDAPGGQTMTSAGELHRDPVCGTFVPGNCGFARNVEGRTVYFCSAGCRDQYLVSARG